MPHRDISSRKDTERLETSEPLGELFEHIHNVRDLSGLSSSDGRQVRPHTLLRTAKLNRATVADLKQLHRLGLSHIIDLRGTDEASMEPDPHIAGAKWIHAPILPEFKGTDPEAQEADRKFNDDPVNGLTEVYRLMAFSEDSRRGFRCFFSGVQAAAGEPVLWHCAQGKDRTGVAALLLLAALDVPQEAAWSDYLLTNEQMQPVYDRMIRPEMDPLELAQAEVAVLVRPDYLSAFIDGINELYGSLEAYLEEGLELSASALERLRDAYLTD